MKISVTDKASEMIKKSIKDKEIKDTNVRIYISGMGWGGPTFGIALDEQKANDFAQIYEDINYIVEKDLIEQFGSFEIDFVKGFLSKGFQVRPKVGGSNCS